MRRAEEFYCAKTGGGCEGYFLTYLRHSDNGNFTVQCPNCGHHHFRVVKEGLVTADRHSKELGKTVILLGLKSTFRTVPWHNDPTFLRQQMQAYGSA